MKKNFLLGIIMLMALLITTKATAQTEAIQLVKDIYTGSNSSNPDWFILYDNKLYFRADGNDGFGEELFVYNGVIDPYRIGDINPGSPSSNPSNFAVFNNKLYFNAYEPSHGFELWVWDGFSLSMVKDIWTGASSSNPGGLTVYNGALYFSADGGGGTGIEMWKYTGTGDPIRVSDIEPGAGSSWPSDFVVFDNKLYFNAYTIAAGIELYVYDGSGPTLVKDIYTGPDGSYAGDFAVYNGALYFSADAGGPAGWELWKYTGSGDPVRVSNIHPSGDASPNGLYVYNGKLYFAAFDGTHGSELWVYDGINPPSIVADINPGPIGSYPQKFTEFKGTLFFVADDGNHGYEVWKYYGIGSPQLVQDLSASGGPSPGNFTAMNDILYFSARDDAHGNELWSFEYLLQKDMFYSQSTYDGWVRETGESTNQGGLINTTNLTCLVGDDALDRQYRTILHYNTSRLPETAFITKASLQIKKMVIIGSNPSLTHGALWSDIKEGMFSNNAPLVKSDFSASPSKNYAGYFKYVPSGLAYEIYRAQIKTNMLQYVNKTGITQFRLHFGLDDDNDNVADYWKIFCGDMGVPFNRPVLRVWYYLP